MHITAAVLECGSVGVAIMASLDSAITGTYGKPGITKVNVGVGKKPGILLSSRGVDVYTHGEMLSAHYYPSFKKYDNFVGNYGNVWWKQRHEFGQFDGAILMTANCIVIPAESYKTL